jgi:hypothetical protein
LEEGAVRSRLVVCPNDPCRYKKSGSSPTVAGVKQVLLLLSREKKVKLVSSCPVLSCHAGNFAAASDSYKRGVLLCWGDIVY